MKTARSLCIGLLCLLALFASVPPSVNADTASQIATSFRRQMRSKRLESRVEAVQKLAEIPADDAAKLLFEYAFTDEAPQVRQAAVDALHGYDDQIAVARGLLEQLGAQRRMDERVSLALPVLAASPDKEVQDEAVRYLDEFLGTPKGDVGLLNSLMDALGLAGDSAASVKTLELLSRAKFFDAHFGYRRSLVMALGQIREPEAVHLLIQLMPRTDGLVRHDLVLGLTRATGETFGNDDRRWTDWWNGRAAEYKLPTVVDDQQQQQSQSQYDGPQYYGIPIFAQRIVFVIDTSGSMTGARIAAAKRELLAAVEALPASTEFDVVAYNSGVHPWQPKLVKADDETKKLLSRAVASQPAGGTTSSHAALQAAFKLEPEAIYFLSDGNPTDATPPQILTDITKLNREKRISLHTIGIGTAFGAPVFGEFMQALSDANLGEFRAVNR